MTAISISQCLRSAIACAVLFSLTACSEDATQEAQAPNNIDSSTNANSTQLSASSTNADRKAAECILAAQNDPCVLMEDAVVRASFGLDEQLLSMKPLSIGSPSCTVSWEGGRQQSIDLGAAGTHSTAVEDDAGVSSIVVIHEDTERAAQMFAMQTRNRSAEEKQKLAEQTAQEVGRTDAIAEEHQEMAQDFARNLMNKLNYQAVEDVGDAAAWGGVGRFKQLSVRVANVRFEVSATVSDDEAANREAAITLAQNVLAHCQ
jgi:hypothetical protein